jgi:hypothetical protein
MITPTTEHVHRNRGLRSVGLFVIVAFSPLMMGSNGCLPTEADYAAAAVPMSAEAFCAQLPTIGFGHFFYCGASQANLQTVAFPDGSRGYCMSADENLGLVGYSAITYNGGAAPVMSQSRASQLSGQLGSQSPGYIRCTRQ